MIISHQFYVSGTDCRSSANPVQDSRHVRLQGVPSTDAATSCYWLQTHQQRQTAKTPIFRRLSCLWWRHGAKQRLVIGLSLQLVLSGTVLRSTFATRRSLQTLHDYLKVICLMSPQSCPWIGPIHWLDWVGSWVQIFSLVLVGSGRVEQIWLCHRAFETLLKLVGSECT